MSIRRRIAVTARRAKSCPPWGLVSAQHTDPAGLRWRVASAALLLSLVLAACSSVADSTRIDFADAPPAAGPACDSALGSYALPKAFLEIQVAQTAPAPPDIGPVTVNGSPFPVNILRHADHNYIFCLDYLKSPLSDDNIQVIKWPTAAANPVNGTNNQNVRQSVQGSAISSFISAQSSKEAFLGAVTFNVTDQTAYIIEALIRSGFILASGNANFATRAAAVGQTQMLADLEYDPFDRAESAAVNARLQKLGICLVLEIYTFEPRIGLDNYCNDPMRYGTQSTLYTKAYRKAEETPANPHWPGLLYRPRYPYKLYIFRKTDPRGPRQWQLSQAVTLRLENLSPVMSLGVTRAVFAGKNMSFVFNEGALQTACVAKTSEIDGFMQIPLQVAKSLVALPASIASVQIGNANSQAQLAKAEQQYYLMQRAYLLNMMGQTGTAPTGAPTTATQPTLPDPSNFTTPSDLVPAPDILTANSPIPSYGSDLFQNQLDSICQGKS
jgi:hypothetical protein